MFKSKYSNYRQQFNEEDEIVSFETLDFSKNCIVRMPMIPMVQEMVQEQSPNFAHRSVWSNLRGEEDLEEVTSSTSTQPSSLHKSNKSNSSTSIGLSPPPKITRTRSPSSNIIDKNNTCSDYMYYVGNCFAKLLLWASILFTIGAVIWYSLELKNRGSDPHLIAWFSAGMFVILGFPISIYGILKHLFNYHQPSIQIYVVRILWMVPIFSIESWLCLRYIKWAIFIETLRDCYESYVLYCFLQFLISVLGGKEALIYLLKDKSPTRGIHMWPMNYFLRPWIMGQPVTTAVATLGGGKRKVGWTSPFFTKCEAGVLQYVVLKNICAFLTLILEPFGLYKEGEFSYKAGYFYVSWITNLSQCWALYCLAFFYYATKNELAPIRPIGKFISVKALVFFTWWQSIGISGLHYMGYIKDYKDEDRQWSAEMIAKALQDYLICIEMFGFAIVHVYVFPYTDYINQQPLRIPTESQKYKFTRRVSNQRPAPRSEQSKNFVQAFIQSTLPRDVIDESIGLFSKDKNRESSHKYTLLKHASTADHLDIIRSRRIHKQQQHSSKKDDDLLVEEIDEEAADDNLDPALRLEGLEKCGDTNESTNAGVSSAES